MWSNLSAILSTRVGPAVAVTGIVHVQDQQLVVESALMAANHDTSCRPGTQKAQHAQHSLSVEAVEPQSKREVLDLFRYIKSYVHYCGVRTAHADLALSRRRADSIEEQHAQDVSTFALSSTTSYGPLTLKQVRARMPLP